MPALVAGALTAVAADTRVIDAAKNQNTALLRTLVKQKADVNAADLEGMTPVL